MEKTKNNNAVSIGLCVPCIYHATAANNRGAEFHLCELGVRDSTFPKYPRLPVLSCKGYQSTKDTKGHEER